MTSVCREIFRAIHEGKWLSIEYKNKDEKITKYWIGIKNLKPQNKMLVVDGLHLTSMEIKELIIYIDSILQAKIIEGSYCKVNQVLLNDIIINPSSYAGLFDQIPNLYIYRFLCFLLFLLLLLFPFWYDLEVFLLRHML